MTPPPAQPYDDVPPPDPTAPPPPPPPAAPPPVPPAGPPADATSPTGSYPPGAPYPAATPYPPGAQYPPAPAAPYQPGGPGAPGGYPYPPAYPPPAGYGPVVAAPPPPSGTNAFAILSLVLSLCGGGLFGLIFGIIALVQTKRTGQSGRGLAIAGVTVSSLYLGGLIIALAFAIVGSAGRDKTGSVNEGGSVPVADIRPGDCIAAVPAVLASRVDVVPCSQPHHSEVFAVFSLTGSSYPGDTTVESEAETGCATRLAPYSTRIDDDLDIDLYYYAPNRRSWTAGDKRVVCMAVDEKHERTGSLRT